MYKDAEYTWDKQRRLHIRYKLKYKLLRASAIDSQWAVIATSWAPWHREQPKLTATVTRPDGSVYTLDPKTLEVSGTSDRDTQTFSDRRQVRGPLPALVVGAVVETVIEHTEHTANFEGGGIAEFYFGSWSPVQRSRATLKAPADLPLNYEVKGMELQPVRTVQGGMQTLVFEVNNPKRWTNSQPNRPPENYYSALPGLLASVADDWHSIATAYAETVQQRLRAPPTLPLPSDTGPERNDIITAALSALHNKVRYTGLELGASALIPALPTEVLNRGYGDCKDKSTLLVGMLRERGIEAHVALLYSGPGPAVLPAVPTISQFNHAVVFVPGARPLWLDATVPHQPVDDIPISLQGRLALIAARDTKGLVRIPELGASASRYFERREVHMADFGAGRVAESSWGQGQMARNLRYRYENAKQADLESSLKGYVERSYGADAVSTVKRSAAPHYGLSLVAETAHWVDTGVTDASVPLNLHALFEWIPKTAFAKEDDPDTRTEPLYIYEPYTAQIDYVIHMPDGFGPKALPGDEQLAMGPALFTRRVRRADKRLNITLTFSSGKRVWSVKERAAFAKAANALKANPTLAFEHRGHQLLSRGQTEAGLRAFLSAIDEAPRASIRHARLAYALLSSGLGYAARDAARRAVKLDPKSFIAQHILGETLITDAFAREYSTGMHRQGAIEAFGRAIALAPESPSAHHHIGRLLLFNDETMDFGSPQELAKGLKHLQKSYKVTANSEVATKIWTTMWASSDYLTLKKTLTGAAASLDRNGRLVAVTAVLDGAEAAHAKVTDLQGASTETVIPVAIQHLVRIGKYQLAADLASPANAGAGLGASQQSKALRGLGHWQDQIRELQAPEQVVIQFLVDSAIKDDAKALWPLLSAALIKEDKALTRLRPGSAFTEAYLSKERYDPAAVKLRSELGTQFVLDSLLNLTNSATQGDKQVGYMVTLRSKTPRAPNSYFFVVLEGQAHKIRAASTYLPGLGAQVLHFLKVGDMTAALQWLDWAREVSSPKPRRYVHAAFRRVWSHGRARDRAAARQAAFVLLADSRASARRAIAPLKKALGAPDNPDRPALQLALHRACTLAQDTACALRISEELHERDPESKAALLRLIAGLVNSKQAGAAQRWVREKIQPKDPDWAATYLSKIEVQVNEDLPAALKVLRARRATSKASHSVHNEYAWNALFVDDLPSDALSAAELAGGQTQFKNAAIVHTLGCVYAHQGDLSKAILALKQLQDLAGPGRPRPSDWYLLGRITEGLGLADSAKQAYQRVPRPPAPNPTHTWWLAQAGLKRIKQGRDTVRGNP